MALSVPPTLRPKTFFRIAKKEDIVTQPPRRSTKK